MAIVSPPNCWSTHCHGFANLPTCPPPAGYETWLDYAVATMDTRSPYNEQLFQLPSAGSPACEREDMRAAVLAELDALRMAAQVADTYPAPLRAGTGAQSESSK